MKVELDLGYSETMAGSMGIIARLRKVVETGETHGLACTRDIIADFADQIEAQLPKPKPEEPTGLGAVVENDTGRLFVRQHDGWWRGTEPCTLNWAAVHAVRVLSEGVAP